MSLLLRLRGLDVKRRGGQRVQGVSLDLHEGMLGLLLGGAGAGKSALIEAILPGDGRRAGTIRLKGVDVERMTPAERRGLGLAAAFQRPALIDALNVHEHLQLGIGGGTLSGDAEERLLTLLPELEGLGRTKPPDLDRRLRRVVDLARALCAAPRVLLIDELGLDLGVPRTLEILKALKVMGQTLLVAERFAAPALETADYAWVMVGGRLVGEGWAADLRDDPDVIAACVGELPLEDEGA